MKNLVDKVLHHATRLDSVVDSFVTDRLRGDRVLTPAELLGAIVSEVTRGVTVGPSGPTFPYNRVTIALAAPTPERESELRGALSPESVRLAIVTQLARQVPVPADLRIELKVVINPTAPRPFTVTLRTVATKPSPPPATSDTASLVSGDGSTRVALSEGVFNIGRVAEIHSRDGRMIRRNQIVLGDESASGTVSRMHARIVGARRGDSLAFTLFDDGSQRGSTVVRGGVPHNVVKGPVGVRLKDGDEVYFGKVRMVFRRGAP